MLLVFSHVWGENALSKLTAILLALQGEVLADSPTRAGVCSFLKIFKCHQLKLLPHQKNPLNLGNDVAWMPPSQAVSL